MAAAAWASQQAFDAWVLGHAAGAAPVTRLAALLLLAYAVVAWLGYRERIAAERLGQGYVIDVRLALFDRLGRSAPRGIHARSRGGHLLRFLGDLSALQQWASRGLARLMVAGVTLVLLLASLAVVAPFVALLVMPAIGLGAAATLALGPRLREAGRQARRGRSRLAALSEQHISGLATVQAFGQLGRERKRLMRGSRRVSRAMLRRARVVGALRAVVDLTAGFATLAILAAAAWAVGAGQATPGAVVSAMTVLGLALPRLRDLGRVHELWQDCAVSRENLRRFLHDDDGARPALARGRDRLACADGEVRLEDLSVEGALQSLSAVAHPGERVAIVGRHGAGKSTLLGVIARLLDADGGRVLVDGMDLAHCRMSSVRRAVGMVGPDLPLLRGTLEHNLRYRAPQAGDEELRRVMALTGVDEIAAGHPLGLAMRVADGGTNLSTGERSRVMLARALLGDPRILLLDAADATLDARAAELFDAVVDSFPGTVLMVTHDCVRARRADRVWHLEAGRLLGDGEPAAALAGAGGLLRPAALRQVA